MVMQRHLHVLCLFVFNTDAGAQAVAVNDCLGKNKRRLPVRSNSLLELNAVSLAQQEHLVIFLLKDFRCYLYETYPWRNRIAREMYTIQWMVGI